MVLVAIDNERAGSQVAAMAGVMSTVDARKRDAVEAMAAA